MADIDRHELHTLVDHIPESDVPAARKVLRALADPVELAILAAPVDDEPETDEERASVASSLADASPDIPFENSSGANGHEASPVPPAGGQGSGTVTEPRPGPGGGGHRAVCPNRLWRRKDADSRGAPTQVARGRLASSFPL